jgi:hypothetical protein
MNELRVALTGERAQLGVVPAADVARLLLLVEKAAAQAAAVVLNQPKTTTGRYRGVIEQAVHFRLRAVEPGSVVPVLELPAPAPSKDGALSMEVVTLGESAVAMLLDSAAEQPHPPHPAVAKALLEVADGMYVGDRYEAVTLQARGDGRPVRTARIDRTVRSRLRAYVNSAPAAPTRSDALMGVLVEADFERRTARLRTATEPAVEVDFPEQLDDDIHAALRQPATLRGEVVYDPKTHSAKTVHLRQLDRGEQLVLGVDPTEFWSEPSFDELARRQGAGHPIDPDAIYDADATDDERDAFLAAISDLG